MNGVEAVPAVDRKPGSGPGRVIAFSRTRWFRLSFGGLLALFAIWAVFSEWSEVRTAVRQLDARWLVPAVLGTVINVALAGMVWRTVLADLGSGLRLPVAARIFFVGQ